MSNYFDRLSNNGNFEEKKVKNIEEERERLKNKIRTELPSFTKNVQLFGVEDDNELRKIKKYIADIIKRANTFLNLNDQYALTEEMLLDITSLGKISNLMKDSSVSEIMINRIDDVRIERNGTLEKRSDIHFKDDEEVMQLARKIANNVGRTIDILHPILDARLPDGSRVNIVIPPVSMDGVAITIRKFFKEKLTIKDLIKFKTLTPDLARFLEMAVIARSNIIASGGTGSGKTTTLNVLSNFVPNHERILTLEDSAELQLNNEHVLRFESRPANAEGKGLVTIRDLVKTSLRKRPDRIVVGEVRDSTAYDLLQAMNTGHEGSLATLHANDPDGAITCMDNLVSEANLGLPNDAIRKLIGNSIDLIVQINRMSDHKRRITHISEITVDENGNVISIPIYEYVIKGTNGNLLVGDFVRTKNEFSKSLKTKFLQNRLDIREFEQGRGM